MATFFSMILLIAVALTAVALSPILLTSHIEPLMNIPTCLSLDVETPQSMRLEMLNYFNCVQVTSVSLLFDTFIFLSKVIIIALSAPIPIIAVVYAFKTRVSFTSLEKVSLVFIMCVGYLLSWVYIDMININITISRVEL